MHVQTYKVKAMTPQILGNRLIAFGDKKGTLLCSEYSGLRWSVRWTYFR